jgi:hypothetical protein
VQNIVRRRAATPTGSEAHGRVMDGHVEMVLGCYEQSLPTTGGYAPSLSILRERYHGFSVARPPTHAIRAISDAQQGRWEDRPGRSSWATRGLVAFVET